MILVYKTNIDTKSRVRQSQRELNKLLPDSEWNFDLEDCDKILRVDSKLDITETLKSAMLKLGIELEELPD